MKLKKTLMIFKLKKKRYVLKKLIKSFLISLIFFLLHYLFFQTLQALKPMENIVKKYVAKEPVLESLTKEVINENNIRYVLKFIQFLQIKYYLKQYLFSSPNKTENTSASPEDLAAIRLAKIKKFEAEMATFTNNTEEKAKLDSLVYSSEFLYLMRNIVKVI